MQLVKSRLRSHHDVRGAASLSPSYLRIAVVTDVGTGLLSPLIWAHLEVLTHLNVSDLGPTTEAAELGAQFAAFGMRA